MDHQLNEIYLITGTNLGDRQANLERAITEIEKHIGSIVARSGIYETEPWGITNQPSFYNQALKVNTAFDALSLLTATLAIEKEMGRIRAERYGTRIIDIDILFFENLIIRTDRLILPHPRIAERNFVLAPLAEIAPDLVHPVLNQTILELWTASSDQLEVKKTSSNER